MGSGNVGAIVRVVALALIAVGFWFLGKYDTGMPDPNGLDAPKTEFSAARADATLARLLGPEIPHPVSTPENANVRARIQQAFAGLGVPTTVYSGMGCMTRPKYGYFVCGTAKDVIAEVQPGEGKAIVMLAHYDSVPAGPGASDDESGVATILESVRAMKAQGIKSKHPILAVITDGEEAGLLGADSFLRNAGWRARVGVAVNVEARGNQGPSLLFQTSPGDSKLIDLYARAVPERETSSLFSVIYKLLPNDTDLTVFLHYGLVGFNFAFSGNVAHYHTTLDRRANLSLSTLQEHGDNMLGVVTALEQTDFASLKGSDDVYLSLYGRWLPRIAASWALPLALISFVLLLITAYLSRTRINTIGQWAAALVMPLVVIVGCAAVGWVLFTIAVLVSGQPDPAYAYPVWLRIALAFGVLSIAVLCTRMAQQRLAALSVWFWFSGLAVVTAALLPGLSPYFLFPALIASVLLLIQSRLPGAWTGAAGDIVVFLAALPVLAIWLSLTATGETVQGLSLHPLFTVPAAFAVITLLPLAPSASRLARGAWGGMFVGAAVVALVIAVVAGTQPAYSAVAPQRLDITLIDDHIGNKAVWIADTRGPLPPSVRAAAPFSAKPGKAYSTSYGLDWFAPAGAPRYLPPTATIATAPDGDGRRATLTLHGSNQTNEMALEVPNAAGLKWFEIGGIRSDVLDNASARGTIIGCATSDCRNQTIALGFANAKPVDITLIEQRFGLPPDGRKIAASRPKEAVASQSGDTVMVLKRLTIR
jgi:hypothetical protein